MAPRGALPSRRARDKRTLLWCCCWDFFFFARAYKGENRVNARNKRSSADKERRLLFSHVWESERQKKVIIHRDIEWVTAYRATLWCCLVVLQLKNRNKLVSQCAESRFHIYSIVYIARECVCVCAARCNCITHAAAERKHVAARTFIRFAPSITLSTVAVRGQALDFLFYFFFLSELYVPIYSPLKELYIFEIGAKQKRRGKLEIALFANTVCVWCAMCNNNNIADVLFIGASSSRVILYSTLMDKMRFDRVDL